MLDCYTDVQRWCAVDTCTGIHEIENANSTSIKILASAQCPKDYSNTISPHPICDGTLVFCLNKPMCSKEIYMHLVQIPFLIKVEENECQTVCPAPPNTPLLCFDDNCTYEPCKVLANKTCNGSSLANTTSFPTMLFLVMGILLHITLIGT